MSSVLPAPSVSVGQDAPAGLVVWVYSYCRSTLATYAALRRRARYDVRLVLCGPLSNKAREQAGFAADEFPSDMFDLIDPDADQAMRYLDAHRQYAHLFSFYHPASRHAALPRHCASSGIPFGIISEAPCNMEAKPHRRLAKSIYYRWLLPTQVGDVVGGAELFVNMSGDRNHFIEAIGWHTDKSLDFGYFPPPLPHSTFVPRTEQPAGELTLLLSGGHTPHRDPMTFLRALHIVTGLGGAVRAVVCGQGPLTGELRAFAAQYRLPVEFRGMVPLDELVRLYQTADLFVAPGANEPWGIRVNDALNCGCPVLVSTGMGASRIVRRFGAGGVFPAGDAEALAGLVGEATQSDRWAEMVRGTHDAARYIAPEAAAQRLGEFMDHRLNLAGNTL